MDVVGSRVESEADISKFMLLCAAALACLPAVANAGVIYKYDDGTAEGAAGLGSNMYLAWMVRYAVEAGGEKINAIEISLPDAIPCEAVLWKDTGGNGDPADAEVLFQMPFTGVAGWNTIPVTPPVTVSGSFFVGAYNYGTSAPINVDGAGYAPHRSWFAADSSALDLNNLAAAPFNGWFEDWGLPYVAMVRAEATPEPATLALLAAGGAAAILRRKRRK
jgi:hypothetical protein